MKELKNNAQISLPSLKNTKTARMWKHVIEADKHAEDKIIDENYKKFMENKKLRRRQ